jgi:serine/threonine protein kinase
MIETGKFLQQRYRIDKQIGQGGMGAVYVATDERFGSRVAIKETLFMDDNFRKAIEREARLLNSLKHTALPRVTDHFEEDNGQFLVMEYIAGEDVATILERERRAFPVEQVMKWADQLLDALEYLHNQTIPVVHRDIKPQNLKVTPKGDVILLDFGLAKGNPTDANKQTAAKSIFGYSKNYASLEQIQGTGTDPRSDLYSLAATLYHILTNVSPEDALTRAMSVLSQKGDPLLPANIVEPTVPKGIAGVLYQAMDLNADSRPSSAAEMREMLRNADDYGHLTDNIQGAVTIPAVNVFAQKTRLMAEGTNAVSQQEVRTEVFPGGQISQETRVNSSAPAGVITDSPRRAQGIGFLAGIGAVVLVGCIAAGAAYLVKPSLFGASSASQQPAPQTANSVETSTAPANIAIAGANANSAVPAPQPPETGAAAKTSESAKTTRKGEPKTDAPAATSNETVVQVPAAEGDLPAGGMVITKKNANGTTTTTRLVPRAPVPGDRYNPFPNGFDPSMFQFMTPAQRQQVRDAVKKARDTQKMNQPPRTRPQPRPENTPEDND